MVQKKPIKMCRNTVSWWNECLEWCRILCAVATRDGADHPHRCTEVCKWWRMTLIHWALKIQELELEGPALGAAGLCLPCSPYCYAAAYPQLCEQPQ